MTPLLSEEIEWLLNRLAQSERPNQKVIRVGLMIDNDSLIRPFAKLIEVLSSSNFVKLVVVVKRHDVVKPRSKFDPRRFISLLKHLGTTALRTGILWRTYKAADEARFAQSAGLDTCDISDAIRGVPVIEVTPIRKQFSDSFSEHDLKTILSFEPDVLLRFGFRILKGAILDTAPYGVWSFHHGDNRFFRGSPPLFWECAAGQTSVGVILQKLTDKLDDGVVLKRGTFANLSSISMTMNKMDPYWSSLHFVIQSLFELSQSRDIIAIAEKKISDNREYPPVLRAPVNREFASWFFPSSVRKLNARIASPRRRSLWRIGLKRRHGTDVELMEEIHVRSFCWLDAPEGRFWADPVLIDSAQGTLMFFEEFVWATGKGRICCAKIGTDLQLEDVRVVLETDYHLSFPNVFEYSGKWYMIPESASNKSVDLYEAVDFPWSWRKRKKLIDQSCVDTLFFEGDRSLFLLTALKSSAGPASIQLLFCAEDIDGPWYLHPGSPTGTDYRYARNGGQLILANGKLIRVSQSAERNYGSSFSYHEISAIDETTFDEKLLWSVAGDENAGMRGTHSYSISKGLIAIDGVWNEYTHKPK